MPSLLTQHWEFWLSAFSAFWEMSGQRETEAFHSGQHAGGRGAERAGSMRGQRPVRKELSVRGLCTRVRAEGDNWQVEKGVCMCQGGGWGPGWECLRKRGGGVQSGWAPCTWEMFAGKTCVPRRDGEHAGGGNESRQMCVQRRGERFVRERDVRPAAGARNRKARRAPGTGRRVGGHKRARACSPPGPANQAPDVPDGPAPAPPPRTARSSLCPLASAAPPLASWPRGRWWRLPEVLAAPAHY